MAAPKTPKNFSSNQEKISSLLILIGGIAGCYFLSGVIYEYLWVSAISNQVNLNDNVRDILTSQKQYMQSLDRTMGLAFGLVLAFVSVWLYNDAIFGTTELLRRVIANGIGFLLVYGIVRFLFVSIEVQRLVTQLQTAFTLRPGLNIDSTIDSTNSVMDLVGFSLYTGTVIIIGFQLYRAKGA